MPRIPTSLLRKAYAIDPLLPRLLPPCRELPAAQNELRWLREHVDDVARARRAKGDCVSKSAFLRDLVRQRATGKPLQYLLGTEYFGDLEISCRPGVLIPRQDTATSVQRLVRLLRDSQNLPNELRVLDLCTGTGCIPLLVHHEFYTARKDVDLLALGVDISDKALRLAVHNLERVRKQMSWVHRGAVGFMKADVLASPYDDLNIARPDLPTALRFAGLPSLWDVVISNPPYISPRGYWSTTTRSVRGFEPKLALVPPSSTSSDDTERGDAFYLPILKIAGEVDARVVLLEIADLDQATRVARVARSMNIFDGIEIWREHPDEPSETPSESEGFPVLGQGNGRSVLCWRGLGTEWLGKPSPRNESSSAIFASSHPAASADRQTTSDSKTPLSRFEDEMEKWRIFDLARRGISPARNARFLTLFAKAHALLTEHNLGATPSEPYGSLPSPVQISRSLIPDRTKESLHPQQRETLLVLHRQNWPIRDLAVLFQLPSSVVQSLITDSAAETKIAEPKTAESKPAETKTAPPPPPTQSPPRPSSSPDTDPKPLTPARANLALRAQRIAQRFSTPVPREEILAVQREIAAEFGCSVKVVSRDLTRLRREGVLESKGVRGERIRALEREGWGAGEIGRVVGVSESTVRVALKGEGRKEGRGEGEGK